MWYEYFAFGEYPRTHRLQASLTRLCGVCEADSWNKFHEPLLKLSCIYMMRCTASYICRNIEAVTTRRSWKFVGQADDKPPRSLENTDYFGTPKNAKTRTSNVISNTFQNHNLIRRNISPFGEDTRQGEYANTNFKKYAGLSKWSQRGGLEICTRYWNAYPRKPLIYKGFLDFYNWIFLFVLSCCSLLFPRSDFEFNRLK